MRKILAVIVSAVAFTSIMTGTAVAGGIAGPYSSINACKTAKKKYEDKYQTGPCVWLGVGYYFEYR